MTIIKSHIVDMDDLDVKTSISPQINPDTFIAVQDFGISAEGHIVTRDPILVKVIFEGDYCIVENEEYSVYANGATATEAIEEFKIHARNAFLRYKKVNPFDLAPVAEAIRNQFLKNFHIS